MKATNKLDFWKTLVHPHSLLAFEEIVALHPVLIKVSGSRKSKYGDFRAFPGDRKDMISVNGNLNQSSFMLTLIHELAHKLTWDEFKRSVDPHGREWKNNMRKLLEIFLELEVFPGNLSAAIKRHIHDWKAVSIRMKEVYEVLMVLEGKQLVSLDEIEFNSAFQTEDGKRFVKGEVLRKYVICTSLDNKRQYKIHKHLLVEAIN